MISSRGDCLYIMTILALYISWSITNTGNYIHYIHYIHYWQLFTKLYTYNYNEIATKGRFIMSGDEITRAFY